MYFGEGSSFDGVRYRAREVAGAAAGSAAESGMHESGNECAMLRKLAPTADCGRIKVFHGDQSEKAFLASLVEARPAGWDIIIDDGSHLPEHQILSFKHLFPALRPGGLYVVEDTETSWMKSGVMYGYDLSKGGVDAHGSGSAISFFFELVHVANRLHIHKPDLSLFEGDSEISSVEFVDGMVLVRKKPSAASDPSYRDYPQKLATASKDFSHAELEKHQAKIRSWLDAMRI